MFKFDREKRLSGFTLVELIMVIVVISILSTIAIVKYGPVNEKAYSAEAFSALAQLVSAENVYQLEYGVYAALPNSQIDVPDTANFTYTLGSTDLTTGFAKADKTKTNKATNDYYMCLKNGKHGISSSCP